MTKFKNVLTYFILLLIIIISFIVPLVMIRLQENKLLAKDYTINSNIQNVDENNIQAELIKTIYSIYNNVQYNVSVSDYFMDAETYDQIPLNKDSVEDALNFIKENENCTMYFYKGNPFAVYPPTFVELEVIDCEPGIQGDTTKASTKPAKVETGYVLGVPLFINIGDKIRIDTRDGSYMERVK